MTHEVVWLDDRRTILHQRYLNGFSLTDFYLAAEASAAMLATVDHPVDIIISMEAKSLPKLNGAFSLAQYVNRIVPPNQRLVVAVGVNSLLRSMVEASRKIAPKATEKTYFVDTLDDALALIQNYNAQLDEQNSTSS